MTTDRARGFTCPSSECWCHPRQGAADDPNDTFCGAAQLRRGILAQALPRLASEDPPLCAPVNPILLLVCMLSSAGGGTDSAYTAYMACALHAQPCFSACRLRHACGGAAKLISAAGLGHETVELPLELPLQETVWGWSTKMLLFHVICFRSDDYLSTPTDKRAWHCSQACTTNVHADSNSMPSLDTGSVVNSPRASMHAHTHCPVHIQCFVHGVQSCHALILC